MPTELLNEIVRTGFEVASYAAEIERRQEPSKSLLRDYLESIARHGKVLAKTKKLAYQRLKEFE